MEVKSLNLSVSSKQRPQGGINVKNPDIPLPQPITNVRLIHRNLPPHEELRIGLILGNGRNFQLLRGGLPLEPNVDIIHHVFAHQMPALGKLTAGHPDDGAGARPGSVEWQRRRQSDTHHGSRRSRRRSVVLRRLRLLLRLRRGVVIGRRGRDVTQQGHETGATRVGVWRNWRGGGGDWGLERRSWVGERALGV